MANYTKLDECLNYLSHNETAYSEHRTWREAFLYSENVKNKALLNILRPCKVCRWAQDNRKLKNNF